MTPRTARQASETTELVETFEVNSSDYTEETFAHDAAGNLTYDGVYAYAYDAWNRLVEVTKAWRTGNVPAGSLNYGSVVQESEYDGLGRRIVKAVQNSAGLDATYHYYYSGHSIVEVRNGSDATLKQYVWGRTYIDELVQTSINDDPADGTEQDCETQYFAMQDANYNVLGIVDASGNLKERYEYTPYGERTVYYSPGPNDPKAMAPTSMSRRVDIDGTLQPYGINEFGHQGLFHDEETGLVYQRARIWNPPLGRFNQPDPLGYPDGMNRFAGYHVLHGGLDPSGLVRPDEFWHQWSQAERQAWFQNFHKELGGMIADSARRNCVPQELLANHGLWAGYLDGILSPQSPYNNPPIGR